MLFKLQAHSLGPVLLGQRRYLVGPDLLHAVVDPWSLAIGDISNSIGAEPAVGFDDRAKRHTTATASFSSPVSRAPLDAMLCETWAKRLRGQRASEGWAA